MALELVYLHGFDKVYDVTVTDNLNLIQNRYVHNGSNLHLSLIYYFKRHHLKI